MKLMYSPGACSIGIHVLLEEIGKPYEAQLVNLREGAQFKPEFTAVNPKSKVPTVVRDDGSVLTEYPAIAYWLARTNPDEEAAAGRRGQPDARVGGVGLRRRAPCTCRASRGCSAPRTTRRTRRTRTR